MPARPQVGDPGRRIGGPQCLQRRQDQDEVADAVGAQDRDALDARYERAGGRQHRHAVRDAAQGRVDSAITNLAIGDWFP